MNYAGYEKGYANMRLVVKEKEDYMFAPFSEVETYDKVYAIDETEKASMRHAIRETEEDYIFAPYNRVFNDFETKNKVFGTIEVFEGYSNIKQTEDNMFQQNKYLGEYAEVANGNSNMRLTNMRYMEDYMFQPDRFLGEYVEVAMGYSNISQTEDNMFQPDKFLGEYAEAAEGYSNMGETENNAEGYSNLRGLDCTGIERIARGPKVVSCGPWGFDNGGMPFDDGSHYTGVREIQLTLGLGFGGLLSIKVRYDLNGRAIWGNNNGGSGVLKPVKIIFKPNEFLTHISGCYGPLIPKRGPPIIKSITFHTNMKVHGPYGDEKAGTRFSSGSKDGIIVGFYGRYRQGWFVHSIGVHVMQGKPPPPQKTKRRY